MFRGMRRRRQQLAEEECAEILRRERRGVLAVLGDDGYPYALPLDFVYEDGKIYFHCAAEGHKIDAIRRCDKASFCVTERGDAAPGEWWLTVRSVIAFGRVRILEGREEVLSRVRALGMKYAPPEYVEKELQRDGKRVQCLELAIEHMTGKRVNEK
jgi:hypothetical protein